jgi:hypothetical protein
MPVCAAYRIPHSRFLRWSALDRGKAIWWQSRQAATCQQCGTRPEEWDEEQGGHLHAYIGMVAHCRGCEVRGQTQEEFDKAPKGAYRRGSYVTMARNPEVR